MQLILPLIIFLLQQAEPTATQASKATGGVLETILLVAAALGAREIIGSLLNRRKTTAETQAIQSKAELDERTHDASEFDKAVKRFNDATDKMVELSQKLLECREKNNELTAEQLVWLKKEQYWQKEKEQIEKALSAASDEVNTKNRLIVELREEAQVLRDAKRITKRN